MNPLGIAREISVDTGKVEVAQNPAVLRTSPLGSCVAVAVYDPQNGLGGIAHVMLPGRCMEDDPERKTRYAGDAIHDMLGKLKNLGAKIATIRACLVGGADVLGDGHEGPGSATVRSIKEVLDTEGIEICAKQTGGTQRRSCTLELASGRIMYTVGDSGQRILWSIDLEMEE